MGFFDTLSDFFDTKKCYTEAKLYEYFEYEIRGVRHGDSDTVTTNIKEIIDNYMKQYFSNAHPYRSNMEPVWNYTGSLEKVDDSTYKIIYIGKILVRDTYAELIGTLYYRVIVYTDKYATLSKDSNHGTTVTVSREPLHEKE